MLRLLADENFNGDIVRALLLPDGGLLDVSELDYETAQGGRLEGHGLTPDETVASERSDLYSGHDRVMESAVRQLTKREPSAH